MKYVLISLFVVLTVIGGGILSISNHQIVFAQNSSYFELSQDETRATTLFFSIKPLDNWAYQNVDYNPANFFGFQSNNAVEMFPNEFDNSSQVYGLIAQDGYYTMKNTNLDQYVKDKMNDPNLKNINGSKLLSKEEDTNNLINGTKIIKLTYDDPNSVYKLALYLLQYNKDNYVMVYRADKTTNLFDKYLPEFEKMIKTIKWIVE